MTEQESSIFESDRRCVIHIGLPRTGTKLLQWRLFSQHSEIEFLGMYIGEIAAGHRQYDRCRDAKVQALMREIGFQNVMQPDLDHCRRLVHEMLPDIIERDRVPVWSWESLSTDVWHMRRARAENLRAVFGDCRIIATIRHPLDLVHSNYFQVLRRENVSQPRNLDRALHATYYTIDDWLEREFDDGELRPHLDYARTIRLYSELFGRESVRVQMFEALKDSPSEYVDGVCRFIGIDPTEGIRLTSGHRDNSRFTVEQHEQLKSIHGSMLKSLAFRFLNNPRRRRLLGLNKLADPGVETSARVQISSTWCNRIEAATRDGNRWLAEEWGLPLEQQGYPL